MTAGTTNKEQVPSAQAWHSQTAEDCAKVLSVHLQQGLSRKVVAKRLKEIGPNELKEMPRPPFWRLVLEQFQNFVVMMLVVASIISACLGDYVEAAAIMAIVLLNAIIGVVQESKAEEALAALKKMTAPNALVIRGGTRETVASRDLVPGDIVVLEAGNYVPADLRLIQAINLQIDEAALTGESVPVEKDAQVCLEPDIPLGDRHNTAFMGTLITYGRGLGIVIATGMHTQMGLIATMLQTLEAEPTPLQQRLDQLGKQLGYACLAICGLVFVVAVFNQTKLSMIFAPDGGFLQYLRTFSTVLTETFMVAVSLAIAAVPEGLPAVVTVTLALGMREMIKRHALIRRLAAVETLGSASVICSDKTGTLTQNQMTTVRLWVDEHAFAITGKGYEPRGDFSLNGETVDLKEYPAALTALWSSVLASDAYIEPSGSSDESETYRIIGDPTEGALVVAAAKVGAVKTELEICYPRVCEVPFDSERKCMSTVMSMSNPSPLGALGANVFQVAPGENGNLYVTACKGAPDVIMQLCTHYLRIDNQPAPLTDKMRQRMFEANESMAREALRVLAVAYRITDSPPAEVKASTIEHSLVFLGLFGMIDPARPEVLPAIAKARTAGIRTIMITGDYPDTAAAIGSTIGLLETGHGVLSGAALDRLDEAGMAKALETTDVFARVNPEHKMRIVDGLKSRGEVVAMTGDGVNDAPALKRSDIGVAMGITGTDVAKETADMVLTDDNYVSIVSAVEQGRIIYANIRKFVFFLLSSNVAEIMIIFLPTLFALPSPMTAIQLLWLNLVTDGAPALALAMEKGDPDIMEQQPRPKSEPIIHGPMRLGIIVQTIAQTGATLTAFVIGLVWHLSESNAVPAGVNPLSHVFNLNWTGVDVITAETMAFVTLSLCELFRAFTVRSERLSLFQIGPFSNPYLIAAVLGSVAVLLMTVFVPFLNPIFNTTPLTLNEWTVVLGLALIPAVTEEFTKLYLRMKERTA
ncbi:cation-translocating P-type ATPase [Desulfomonile tiedjei]|uniref:P-type ATPase, translocating n=1 Tax=Desulfomonile tiedjei (strain ATCC 49306 / DSM 6799 / DCB-1) TaxID=706587 RepID=I4C2J8_DESTA|nr:cation-translocating P-type ATPase [Desulfomonile tiedjei]AFM23789.1 P-type ATPase, translocating [Desulfomonile tiedjei DSM 6799]